MSLRAARKTKMSTVQNVRCSSCVWEVSGPEELDSRCKPERKDEAAPAGRAAEEASLRIPGVPSSAENHGEGYDIRDRRDDGNNVRETAYFTRTSS